MSGETGAVLVGEALIAGYGAKRVLNGVNLSVFPGEIVAVIGHNGAGKSTLLKAIFGLVPLVGGRVKFQDEWLTKHKPYGMVRRGMGFLFQGNRVFGTLTVQENLQIAAACLKGKIGRREALRQVLAEYPVLEGFLRRKADSLSGGEQQLLALAMASVPSPSVMLLDEPSLGLAPKSVQDALARVSAIARKEGRSVLIVEQKVREVLRIADRVYVIRNGTVAYSGAASELEDYERLRQVYL